MNGHTEKEAEGPGAENDGQNGVINRNSDSWEIIINK